ncbi:InlB B-repeat-containing protein [Adlercreutzia caecimuris]|uniref:InlB B-repeat-containing protein n=2 Tax=Adlercreutzia caecimuris TaxID=671266 RepID=UPI001C3E97CC|nr:InlB B-repeat-containing protein [Adlercreutzia caecimuris]
MTAKALRVFLASLLTLALIPTAALADDGDSNEVRASYEPEGYHDEGAGEPVTDGDSWRITDGVPNNVWLEENEDAGIATFGAFSDVGDSYRATWSAANGVGTYIDRKKPTDKGTVITVPNVLEVGVDISYFNNEKGGKHTAIDWNKMKADGITFAIIRIGDGGTNGKGFDDPWFVQNIQGAQAAGIKVGAYLFSRATHLGKGDFSVDNEINQTLDQLKAAGIQPGDLQLPVYLDLECQAQRDLTKKKGGAELLGQIAVAWCSAIQAAGYNVGIYANTDWFNNVLTDEVFSKETMAANQWSRWVARYSWGGTSSKIENTDIWQFTSIGLVNGTPRKYCDVNFSYVNFGEAPKMYTVKYKLNGGKMVAANPVSYNNVLSLPTPTRAGYKFDGWYTDKNFKNKVKKLTKKNATLYAKWSQPYAIKYVMNKGKNHKSNPKKYGGTITLKNPTRSGYTFKGWYADRKFKKKVTKLTNKNATLYAKWAKNYKITYKLNGGKNSKGNPKKASGTVKLKSPTRAGYVFKGWYTNKRLTKRVTKLSMTKNRTVYAKWQKLRPGTYKVTAKSGLNLRKSASTSSRILKTLRYAKKIKITKIKGGWGYVRGGGWVNLAYARRV